MQRLAGDLGAAASYLQLAQGIQSGDKLVIVNAVNALSEGAANDDQMRKVAW